jgi:hypothetical protein
MLSTIFWMAAIAAAIQSSSDIIDDIDDADDAEE